jgi:hypothetical protein
MGGPTRAGDIRLRGSYREYGEISVEELKLEGSVESDSGWKRKGRRRKKLYLVSLPMSFPHPTRARPFPVLDVGVRATRRPTPRHLSEPEPDSLPCGGYKHPRTTLFSGSGKRQKEFLPLRHSPLHRYAPQFLGGYPCVRVPNPLWRLDRRHALAIDHGS